MKRCPVCCEPVLEMCIEHPIEDPSDAPVIRTGRTKPDPDVCPRCHSAMAAQPICIGLTELRCACGYTCRDRDQTQRAAQDQFERLPKIRIY